MRPKRIFIAINLPESTKKKLLAYQDKWPELPARWTTKENLHLTLVFLGNTSEAELQQLTERCRQVGESHKPFELRINHIQYGPNEHRPRMIWAALETSQELLSLQKDLETTPEKQPYSPHLTLARLRLFELQRMEQEELPQITEDVSLSFPVDSFEIMESELARSGAKYVQLQQFVLEK
jgi:2'-5' RNA ligase